MICISEQNTVSPYLLLVLLATSAAIFYVTGENILKLEHTKNFDCSNPLYLFNVVVAASSLGTGTVTFIECFKLTKKGVVVDETEVSINR